MNVSVEGYTRKEETEEKARIESGAKSYSLRLCSREPSQRRVHSKGKKKEKKKKKKETTKVDLKNFKPKNLLINQMRKKKSFSHR